MGRPDTPPPTELAALNEHISALAATDRQLRDEQIHLERRSVAPELPQPGPNVGDRTQHYLNGFASPVATGLSDGQRLQAILVDRGAISQALSQLEQRRQAAMAIEAKAAAEAATPRWRALKRRAVLVAEELRAVEAEIAGMRSAKGGQLLEDGHLFARSILGTRWSSDPVHPVRTAMLRSGVITKRDLEEATRV